MRQQAGHSDPTLLAQDCALGEIDSKLSPKRAFFTSARMDHRFAIWLYSRYSIHHVLQFLCCGKQLTTSDVQALTVDYAAATIINFSQNVMTKIPSGLPSDMVALDLSRNLLTNLYGFENVRNLQQLYLGGNAIER